jgi:hypothetical protein
MERKCFGHGRPYAFAPQEWSANVMPAAYRFRASLFAMTIIDRELLTNMSRLVVSDCFVVESAGDRQ